MFKVFTAHVDAYCLNVFFGILLLLKCFTQLYVRSVAIIVNFSVTIDLFSLFVFA